MLKKKTKGEEDDEEEEKYVWKRENVSKTKEK